MDPLFDSVPAVDTDIRKKLFSFIATSSTLPGQPVTVKVVRKYVLFWPSIRRASFSITPTLLLSLAEHLKRSVHSQGREKDTGRISNMYVCMCMYEYIFTCVYFYENIYIDISFHSCCIAWLCTTKNLPSRHIIFKSLPWLHHVLTLLGEAQNDSNQISTWRSGSEVDREVSHAVHD